MYIEMICLFVNGYLNSEQFEDAFLTNIFYFEKLLENDVYIKIISTNFNSKNEIISLKTFLRAYLNSHYIEEINNTNDANVERIVESDRKDVIAKILRKHYEKKEIIHIECKYIKDFQQLIYLIKDELQISKSCGNNLDAINDLIYDINFPNKIIFHNWSTIESKFLKESRDIKEIFEKKDECKIIFD